MKKLALSKETIRMLNDFELSSARGGSDETVNDCFTILATCQPVTIAPCILTDPCPTLWHCKTWKC